MNPFRGLVKALTTRRMATLVWTLCGARGGASIRVVIRRIQSDEEGFETVCAPLLELSDDELERAHSVAFKLFSTCAQPSKLVPLKAESVAAASPYEASLARHKQVLINRAKK